MFQCCFSKASIFVLLAADFLLAGCVGGASRMPADGAAIVPASSSNTRSIASSGSGGVGRSGFVGAFFRAEGSPPFGVFTPTSSQIAPQPYPTPGAVLTGQNGYCDEVAANGHSIDNSFVVDDTKLTDLIYLGARWTRLTASQFAVDVSHIFGTGNYAFGTLDAAQCSSYVIHHIKPVIGLEAGPVEYDAVPGTFSPVQVPTYESAADFGRYCGVIAAHEKSVFPGVKQFSEPGNEVNTNPGLFPGGLPQIAAYSKACYSEIKAANPSDFVYGFELNMDGNDNAPGFVRSMLALGCGPHTCYDGIAIHLSLRYPIPPSTTPCYPNPGGDYSMQCVTDIETASRSAVHVLISETVYTVPGTVPDEQTKANAAVAAFTAFAADPTVDGVNYANVDECGLYQTGYFSDGCLISTSGEQLPAYAALQWYAAEHFL
jgi:hypothetical protein